MGADETYFLVQLAEMIDDVVVLLVVVCTVRIGVDSFEVNLSRVVNV